MKTLYYILLISIILLSTLAAQDYKCIYCNDQITSDFVIVEGKYFHIEHFKCNECNKPIEGEFTKSDKQFYHSQCYFNEILPKCDVCQSPLDGEFFQDIYNKRYHKFHLNEISHCDNCNRFAAPRITNGGRYLEDGRYICNICNTSALKTENQYVNILAGIRNRLKNIGLRISSKPISIFPVNRNELISIANSSANSNLRGFCKITTEYSIIAGEKTIKENYSIYVLDNLPSIYSESTIAHELMHVWLHENTENNHEESLEEGSCHYISYLYLKTIRSDEANWIIKLMLNDQNVIYGGGFRNVHAQFHQKPLSELLDYLKREKKL